MDKNREYREKVMAQADAIDELLTEGNSVAIITRIDGATAVSAMKIPDVPNLTDDDNIGTVGFALGRHIDLLSSAATKNFNELVEKRKDASTHTS